MSALAIIAIILCGAGVLACVTPRLPGVVLSYAGLLAAHFAGDAYVDGAVLLYWAVATILAVGIAYFTIADTKAFGRGYIFVTVGAVAGTLLGFLVSPASAALIGGSAVGAVLGALAFRSTSPQLKVLPFFSTVFINFMCPAALRTVVACSICGITAATLL